MTTTTATAYDPANTNDRRALAVAIHRALAGRGFEITGSKAQGGEVVYRRDAGDGVELKVYSSIDWAAGRCRPEGADAIRVCAVYTATDGKTRGLDKETRVNRTGTVEGIVERMMTRGKAVWDRAQDAPRCKCCGAPTFQSAKGNRVCAELCWLGETKSAVQKAQAKVAGGFLVAKGATYTHFDKHGNATTKTAHKTSRIHKSRVLFVDVGPKGYFVKVRLDNGESAAINVSDAC